MLVSNMNTHKRERFLILLGAGIAVNGLPYILNDQIVLHLEGPLNVVVSLQRLKLNLDIPHEQRTEEHKAAVTVCQDRAHGSSRCADGAWEKAHNLLTVECKHAQLASDFRLRLPEVVTMVQARGFYGSQEIATNQAFGCNQADRLDSQLNRTHKTTCYTDVWTIVVDGRSPKGGSSSFTFDFTLYIVYTANASLKMQSDSMEKCPQSNKQLWHEKIT